MCPNYTETWSAVVYLFQPKTFTLKAMLCDGGAATASKNKTIYMNFK